MTECSCEQFEFHGLGRRAVVARFDGGPISTDGGALLLREVEAKTGLLARVAEQFTDHRDPALTDGCGLPLPTARQDVEKCRSDTCAADLVKPSQRPTPLLRGD
jgi:hypothetical protein